MPTTLKTVDITIPMPWGPIAGKTYGDERSAPILCVHGTGDNLETFCNLLPLLPQNLYYVCIDLPCHGKSAHADKGYILNLMWYAMCVKRVIDFFQWKKVYFLGHSLGAHIGFILSALYSELISKLIMVEGLITVHTSPPNMAASLRNRVFDPFIKIEERNFDQAPLYSFAEFVMKMKKARKTEVTEEQLKAMADRNLKKVSEDKFKYANDQRTKILSPILATHEQLVSLAKEICCPTLVVLGRNSLNTRPSETLDFTPENNIKHVTIKVIEGDHDIHLTRPREVARFITTFLSEETLSKL